jgi:23S rRNA (guanosine2251-2'-O)-methyltransferase
MRKLKLDELNRVNIEEFKELDKLPVVVILDNVRSMNNVGSVFRTADGFAIEKVVLCGITAQPPHREIERQQLGNTIGRMGLFRGYARCDCLTSSRWLSDYRN